MHNVRMTDAIWASLRALRSREGAACNAADPAFALYGPIASAEDNFVVAQVGQSLDGRIATLSGDARDVSGPDGLAHLHRCRALTDAVIVGEGTMQADDPSLSVYLVEGEHPVRVIIDCHARLSGEEKLFQDGGAPVIVIQGEHAERKTLGNADIISLPAHPNGIDARDILAALHARGLRRILVEGGARTIARFLDAGLVDRLHVAISPIIIGAGPAGIILPPIDKLSDARRPSTEVYDLGSDILFDCRFG
ncbi:RibD family protein [Pseudohoeflea suaedae]|uniref:RibD family protein n=1 Tax=Pseudohoeflea suaedae TaxID=877384 RepID=A0A4R5PJ07_9HYPH|nr:RibD family protein [Pseudohoeflea suaedae]